MLVSLVLAGVTGALAATAHGALHRNSPMFGRVLSRLPTRERRIAITFDDGPNPDATPRILDTLAEHEVKATFFLLGRHVERWPGIAHRVAEDGHAIGNHGYHHRKLHLRSPSYVRSDLRRGTEQIQSATGRRVSLFRAPHGFRNPWVTQAARALGQQIVGWSLGVWDSDKPGTDVNAQRAIAGCEPGTILLLHDGDGYDATGDRSQTADALPTIISTLRQRGFEFVPLE